MDKINLNVLATILFSRGFIESIANTTTKEIHFIKWSEDRAEALAEIIVTRIDDETCNRKYKYIDLTGQGFYAL